MIEVIKKEAKIIKEILKKERELSIFNDIGCLAVFLSLFKIISLTISVFFFTELTDYDKVFICIILNLLFPYLFYSINYNLMKWYNKTKNKNYPKNSGSLFLSDDNLIKKEKKEEIYSLYNKLSKEGKEELYYLNYMELRNSSIKKIEIINFERKIMLMDLNLFIDYFNNNFQLDKKEFKIDEEKLIYNKIIKILEKIKEAEFNEYKEDVIYIMESLKSKKYQLELFELVEKLKEKYDESLLDKKISLIKDKVIRKKEVNNKVLRNI